MQQPFERDIGDEAALTGHEAAILAHPALARDEAEGCGIGAHFAFAPAATARAVLDFCSRSAANCTASMICP